MSLIKTCFCLQLYGNYLKNYYNRVCSGWGYLLLRVPWSYPQGFSSDSRGMGGQEKNLDFRTELKYIDNFKNPYLVKSQISQVIPCLFCGEKLIFLGTTLVCYIFEISYGTNFVCLSDLVLLLQGKEFELFAFDKIWGL